MFVQHGINGLLRVLDPTERHAYPDIFESIRQLTKEPGNALEAFREKLMHPVLHRTRVAHVADVDLGSDLSDPLYPPLALFEPGGVPRQAQVDERPEPCSGIVRKNPVFARSASIRQKSSAKW